MNRIAQGAVRLLGLALALVTVNAMADDGRSQFSWSTGLEYSSGSYGGSEDIEDLYVPVTGRLDTERLSFELTVPYVSVRAPAGTIVTGPGTDPLPGAGEILTESGPGDVVAGVTIYDVIYNADLGIALDMTGKIKFGTADAQKGLGTGESDYTVRADLFKFFERFSLMGSVGYKLRGDPAGIDLENVVVGSVGGVFEPTDGTRFGLIFDYRESALIDGDAISELSAFVSRPIKDNWHIQFYTFTGFSDSSADWGAGILLHFT